MTARDNVPLGHRYRRMLRYFFSSVLLLLFFLSVATAAPPATLSNPDTLKYPDLKFSIPRAERIVIDKGMILYYLKDHEVPLVTISAIVRCGSIYEPVGKEGLAELTARVMRTGGTAEMAGKIIDEELEYLAATVNISLGKESGSASLSVLKKDVDIALKIFSEILRNPAFDNDQLKLAKDLKIEELMRIADDPQKLAFREFNRILYRHNARGRLPSQESIRSLGQQDLVLFHKRFFSPHNVIFTITGDVTREEAIRMMRQYFGDWQTEAQPIPDIEAPKKQQGSVYFLLKNVPQAVVIYGQHAPAITNNDYFPFEILDFILGGGGFRSRIFQEVRNNLGLAYSTGSFYQGRKDYGVFGAYAFSKSESAVDALTRIRSILSDVKANGVNRDEFDRAKRSIINSFIFSFVAADQIVHQQAMIEYDHLPDDHLLKYRERIQNVRSDQLKNVANNYLLGDDAIYFVLGEETVYRQLQSQFKNVRRVDDTGVDR